MLNERNAFIKTERLCCTSAPSNDPGGIWPDVAALAAGSYILQVHTGSQVQYLKLLKQ